MQRKEVIRSRIQRKLRTRREQKEREIAAKVAVALSIEAVSSVPYAISRMQALLQRFGSWVINAVYTNTLVINPIDINPLVIALHMNPVPFPYVRFLLSNGADLKQTISMFIPHTNGAIHATVFHASVITGNERAVTLLLECGADVNKAGTVVVGGQSQVFTPLEVAVRVGHIRIVRILLANGSKFPCSSVVAICCEKGRHDIVRLLLATPTTQFGLVDLSFQLYPLSPSFDYRHHTVVLGYLRAGKIELAIDLVFNTRWQAGVTNTATFVLIFCIRKLRGDNRVEAIQSFLNRGINPFLVPPGDTLSPFEWVCEKGTDFASMSEFECEWLWEDWDRAAVAPSEQAWEDWDLVFMSPFEWVCEEGDVASIFLIVQANVPCFNIRLVTEIDNYS